MVSGYIRLYYMPMTSRRDSAVEEAKMCRAQTEAAELRLAHMRQMEAAYRCMLDDINIAVGQENTGVQVDGTIVFCAYMK